MIIGGAVIINGNSSSHFFIENNVPILRQADIMTEKEATSPCRRIYLVIQLMYLDEQNSAKLHPVYWDLVKAVVDAAPSMTDLILKTSQCIVAGKLYKALKHAKNLISYEEELLNHVTTSN